VKHQGCRLSQQELKESTKVPSVVAHKTAVQIAHQCFCDLPIDRLTTFKAYAKLMTNTGVYGQGVAKSPRQQSRPRFGNFVIATKIDHAVNAERFQLSEVVDRQLAKLVGAKDAALPNPATIASGVAANVPKICSPLQAGALS
jgi:hypothetical protein